MFERDKRYEGNMIVLADNDDRRLKFLKKSRIHEHPYIIYSVRRSIGPMIIYFKTHSIGPTAMLYGT